MKTMDTVESSCCLQMFERETKREKILEARQREIRLKERSRSEQSREDDGGREDGEESPDQLIDRAEKDFYSVVETELRRRRERDEETCPVLFILFFLFPNSRDKSLLIDSFDFKCMCFSGER